MSATQRNRPRLWVSVCSVLLIVCGAIGCFALAAGLFELALACVGPVLVSGALLLLAGEMGWSN